MINAPMLKSILIGAALLYLALLLPLVRLVGHFEARHRAAAQ